MDSFGQMDTHGQGSQRALPHTEGEEEDEDDEESSQGAYLSLINFLYLHIYFQLKRVHLFLPFFLSGLYSLCDSAIFKFNEYSSDYLI